MREFHIKDHGAVGDGITLNTAAIQRTIDACANAGGGRVLIGGGTYLSGSIALHSNIELHIEADGVLLGSPDCSDYPEREGVTHVDSYRLPRHRNACFIFAKKLDYIFI